MEEQLILHEQSDQLTNRLAKDGDFYICGS